MRLVFSEEAWEDYLYWQANDKKILRRVNDLLRDIRREPFGGVGKPEALKHQLQGWWSRRITSEHRLVYTVEGGDLLIAALRFHYE